MSGRPSYENGLAECALSDGGSERIAQDEVDLAPEQSRELELEVDEAKQSWWGFELDQLSRSLSGLAVVRTHEPKSCSVDTAYSACSRGRCARKVAR